MIKPKKAFSLIEILVTAIIIGIGVAFVATSYITGKYLVKRAENEATAMSIAFARKESLLAKSYTTLLDGGYPTSGTEGIFIWQTQTTLMSEPRPGLPQGIPFIEVVSEVTYSEQGVTSAQTAYSKKVTLKNIVPYPFVHIEESLINGNCSASGCTVIGPPYASVEGDPGHNLQINVHYPVDKDIVIVYGIAIDITDSTGIDGADTIYSRCFINGAAVGVEARTPIFSQPLISSMTSSQSLPSSTNDHVIEVRWYKDTANGVISIKRANLAVIAYER